MAFTNFCCRSGGSNLNAGTLTGNTTEPGTGASFTYASGTWVAGTGVFTVASGDPSGDGVAVGDFASVYADGSTVTGFVGRITARDTTTITVSLTAKSGTAPADGTNTRTLKVGGAWLGPNAASGFPLNFAATTMTNSAGDITRVNFKNDATYSITAAMTHDLDGPVVLSGYTSSYGDGGRASVDGGTSGASYVLLTMGTSFGNNWGVFEDFILANNGATGSANAFESRTGHLRIHRVVCHDVRGSGFSGFQNVYLSECEAYACNQSNTSSKGGFEGIYNGARLDRCIAHDNAGSNTAGFISNGNTLFTHCIADTNGNVGFSCPSSNSRFEHCDAYNNTSHGIDVSASTFISITNCNLVKNGGWGINRTSGVQFGHVMNCGFGSGTQANTSGNIDSLQSVVETGTVNYAADVTPWVDPANGDFRINLATAINAGRGSFTQTAASYAGAIGYPDIGAVQHLESAGGGSLLRHPGMNGGLNA